jgi:hypothetical protein
MKIEFTKPELDLSGVPERHVQVTVKGYDGTNTYASSIVIPSEFVGTDAWTEEVRHLYIGVLEGILGRNPPKEFTVIERR